MFFRGSRYGGVETLEMRDAQGRTVRYKGTRFIPNVPAAMAHRVNQGERLDHIAHQYFRDSERRWRICDANQAMWPPDLVSEPGTIILIPAAEG